MGELAHLTRAVGISRIQAARQAAIAMPESSSVSGAEGRRRWPTSFESCKSSGRFKDARPKGPTPSLIISVREDGSWQWANSLKLLQNIVVRDPRISRAGAEVVRRC